MQLIIPACRYVCTNRQNGKNPSISSWGPISEQAGEMGINLVSSCHVETVVHLINQNAKAKHHVNIGVDAEDYYKIKVAHNTNFAG